MSVGAETTSSEDEHDQGQNCGVDTDAQLVSNAKEVSCNHASFVGLRSVLMQPAHVPPYRAWSSSRPCEQATDVRRVEHEQLGTVPEGPDTLRQCM